MTKTITTATPDWFEDFKRRILSGLNSATEAIQKAASAYVEAVDSDPAFKDYLAEACPEVSGGIWRSLEQVGRGMLDARIATGGCPFGNKLRRLTMSEQRQALDGTVPFLTAAGDTLQLRLDTMMPLQAEQVFAAGHIRSLAEQKAWQEAKAVEAMKAKKLKPAQSIEINRRKRCIVVNGVTLSAADLADYLRKISE